MLGRPALDPPPPATCRFEVINLLKKLTLLVNCWVWVFENFAKSARKLHKICEKCKEFTHFQQFAHYSRSHWEPFELITQKKYCVGIWHWFWDFWKCCPTSKVLPACCLSGMAFPFRYPKTIIKQKPMVNMLNQPCILRLGPKG